ncbi:unnamed protein product, partial [Brenthis ino]
MSSPSQPKKPKSPSDDNKSFVEQMATKMTRLLPNTITKWFSSPSNANGSTQVAESTDSSTEDESTDSPLVNQPAAKRMRYNLPGPSNVYYVPETRSISTNTEPVESSNPGQSIANRSTFTLETNSKSSDETSVEKKSTSPYILQDSLACTQRPSRKRKSLYDITTSSNQHNASSDEPLEKTATANEYSQPYFKSSLAVVSPFYPGKTKYGGASSSYINQPNIKFTKTTHINNTTSNNDATMSNSTKRIMDLLDNFSSPTIDARRIPQIISSPVNNTNQSLNSTATSKRHLSFKNNELHVPGIASILKLKQSSRLMSTTSVARQIIASQSSSSNDTFPPRPTRSSTPNISEDKNPLKMRVRVSKRDYLELEPTVLPVNLPTATLQIDKDNLPKFSFGNAVPEPTSSSKQSDVCISNNSTPKLSIISSSEPKGISTDEVKINEKPVNEKPNSTQRNTYTFASPVRISVEAVESLVSSQKFAFGSPERNVEDQNQNINRENNISTLVNNSQKAGQKTIQQDKESEKDCSEVDKCTDCQADLKQGCSGKCFECEKEKSAPNKPEPLTVVATLTKWRCPDCWVDNEEVKDKCVCCGGNKPTKTKTSSTILTDKKDNDNQIYNKIKIRDNLTSNEISKSSDITPSISIVTPTSNVSTLDKIVKMQSSKWECPNCLVRNDNNKSKCACCETEKPGTAKELQNKTFNFGVSANVFKFGINPKQNVPKKEAEVKSVDLKPFPAKESETNNNVLLNNKFEIKADEVKSSDPVKPDEPAKQSEVSKPTFSFGIPKESTANTFGITTSTPVGFSMILPKDSEKAKTEHDDKPKAVPEMNLFGIKPIINSTASPLTKATTLPILNKPFTITESTTNIATTSEQVAPQSTFSFSSGLTQPVNLLNPQTSTTASETSSVSASPAISSIQNSPAPTLPFFSKNEISGNSQSLFFQKNESELSLFPKTESATTTVAPQPPISSSPIFSFGNNLTQNVQPNIEKPKFTFTFGANKSDAPTLFNPPPAFGALVENKFNLPTSNTISSGLPVNNTMNNSGLPNSNGLSTGNPLAGLARGNGLGAGTNIGGDGLSNPLNPVNNLMAGSSSTTVGAGNLFGGIKKDMWSGQNNTGSGNIFVSNTTTNSIQKPAAFTFGASTSFNANSAAPTHSFGNPTQPPQPAQPAQSAQPLPNLFGVVSPNNQQQQPTLFSNTVQNQATPNVFGTTQSPVPSVGGMFGTPRFGAPNTMFEAPPMNPTPAMNPTPTPSFSFGAQQPQSSIFSFSQQPQLQQQPGVYNFGAPGGSPAVQFNMGSAPSATGRRVKKAIRRTTPRP